MRNVYNEGVTREYANFQVCFLSLLLIYFFFDRYLFSLKQQAELQRSGIVSSALLDIGNLTVLPIPLPLFYLFTYSL